MMMMNRNLWRISHRLHHRLYSFPASLVISNASSFSKFRSPFNLSISCSLLPYLRSFPDKPHAEKCRQLVGEEASSQSGKFTILNCFDMGSGTAACLVKEGVKLYVYNIRSAHVERARHNAIGTALTDALTQGLDPQAASKQAQKEGQKAAKLASRQAKRIIGPIISSGWDFFEAIYYGGTVTEGTLRGTGTLFGAYSGGFLGEQRIGRFGYLVGSHLGSWVGGRIGLMVYDVINGVHFLLQYTETEEGARYDSPAYDSSEVSEESYEAPAYENSEVSEESFEAPTTESSEVSGSSYDYEKSEDSY